MVPAKWLVLTTAVVLVLSACSSSDADLSEAVADGDAHRVRELVDQGADLNEPIELGMTPLMRAANRGDERIATILIDAGADVNLPGMDDLTPLHIAARSDSVGVGELLIDHGADPAVRSASGMNALDQAAAGGSVEFVELLLWKTSLDVDAPSEAITQGHGYPRDLGPTPLGLAVREGRTETVSRLLDLGARVDAPSASAHTPLLLAIFFDQSAAVVQQLLDAGADPDATATCDAGCSTGGGEPLNATEWAIALGREQLVPLLDSAR